MYSKIPFVDYIAILIGVSFILAQLTIIIFLSHDYQYFFYH